MVRLFNSPTLSFARLLVFLLLLGNIGCQKEMSKDTLGSRGTGGGGGSNSGGTAVFTLVPTGNNCSNAAVTGVIEAGTTLGADAVLTVTVNVTKVGDWTYSTAISDGFSFVGAGNFTTTGAQVITLQAIGKPIRAGVFSFTLTIGGGSCLVPVLVANAGSGGGTGGGTGGNASDYYYKAIIDGVTYNVSLATTGYLPGYSKDGLDDVVIGGGIAYNTPSGTTIPAGKTEFMLYKGIMHQYTSAAMAQFQGFFAPATYSFAPYNFTTDGVILEWTDPSGDVTQNMWDTGDGKDQTGSSFKITGAQDMGVVNGYPLLKVTIQFNCNLYNEVTGARKKLINGEAALPFPLIN
jgi:hypothetical protein